MELIRQVDLHPVPHEMLELTQLRCQAHAHHEVQAITVQAELLIVFNEQQGIFHLQLDHLHAQHDLLDHTQQQVLHHEHSAVLEVTHHQVDLQAEHNEVQGHTHYQVQPLDQLD